MKIVNQIQPDACTCNYRVILQPLTGELHARVLIHDDDCDQKWSDPT